MSGETAAETVDGATPYRTRLSALFAAEAPKAIILRRGPKRHFRLIAWDLETDAFTPGQWMTGVVGLCDLSPVGDKLLYWAAQYGRAKRGEAGHSASTPYDPVKAGYQNRPRLSARRLRKLPLYLSPAGSQPGARTRPNTGSWTAISTPPYFTALAFWPSHGKWTGGGVFRSEREVVLYETRDGMTPVAHVPLPKTLRVSAFKRGGALLPSAYQPSADESPRHIEIAETLRKCGAEWVDWISQRREPDMLFAADGRIYRLEKWLEVPETDYLRRARLLADFRDMSFEGFAAPAEALTW